MIIAAKILLTDAEFAQLKEKGDLDIEVALSVFGRLRDAIQKEDFDVYAAVEDHVNVDGQLVSAGKIVVKLDR